MAVLPVQTMVLNGSIDDLVYTAVDAGLTDTLKNDGKTIAIVKNADAAPHTVTPTVQQSTGNMQQDAGAARTITNAKETVLGPWERKVFNDASGDVSLVFDSNTSMTVAVLSLSSIG